jgi:threonine/homoserine/homoserine lactone efflux protein
MPGPAVLLIFSQGLIHGTKKSVSGIFGVLIGNLIFFSLSAVGVGAVLIASSSLFIVVRILGAIYLFYLGLQFILNSKISSENDGQPIYPSKRLFIQGLATQLSNPKAIVFFVSLYPQFISLDSPAIAQFAILGSISIIIEFQVLLGYSWLAERSKQILRKSVFQTIIYKLGGAFLIGAGIRILTLKNEA